jgi:hypothetical protein
MKHYKQIIILVIVIVFINQSGVYAQSDSLPLHKNAVKIDLVPYYYDFFDIRKQVRGAVELERYLDRKSSVSLFCDIGLYDDYTYRKYYDFFNQNQGLHWTEQRVQIRGFHLQPSYNRYFLKSEKRLLRNIYAGAGFDFQYYWKLLEIDNSLIEKSMKYDYYQLRLGAGLHIGLKYFFGKHFFTEVKTKLYTCVFTHVSQNGMNPIRPLNTQWTDSGYKFWWVSNLIIGYAF